MPVVREEWLLDSIEKQEPQPMEADDVSDLFVEGKGIPWDQQYPEAPKSISAELKLYGKRGVYKDTKLQERGGRILEKDGIVYCIMQLITVLESNLHLYYKKGKVGNDPNAEERLEERENAIKEFGRLFEELNRNEFEPWEREKKFEKKRLSFYPIYMDYGVAVENIFPVEPSACPPLVEIKKLPNKVVLWCGTRSSNMLRHLQKGFLPSVCSLPVPVFFWLTGDFCSDAAAEAGRYGFTAVDRPEGFLALAVASLGDQVIKVESPLETGYKVMEEKKFEVKALERKTTDESEHFLWKDEIKVPCGRLIPSVHKDSPLEYNEYAIYDPKQTSIRFLMDTAEP
ncbi:hypothetical protein Peur_052091 [Populus x canadensis]